jgi:uncharacterized protein (DUF2252 family)
MGSRGDDPVEWTVAYESWLGRQIPLVPADLAAKHREMADSTLRFLRGSYYLWLERLGKLLPDVLDSVTVPIVGDLHVENFGTWRDRHLIRRWGVNDLDESGRGAYGNDLVRLATSAVLAPHIGLPDKDVCAVLLDAWSNAAPTPAVDVDADSAGHLRHLLPEPEQPDAYYARLTAGPESDPDIVPAPVRTRVGETAPPGWRPTWHHRVAGTGSLGRPRLVAVGSVDGVPYAREVKLLAGSTAAWARTALTASAHSVPRGQPSDDESVYDAAMARLPGPDPSGRVQSWQYRGRSPGDVRIEISGLGEKASERLLRSMGQAVVNIHALDVDAFEVARAHAAHRPKGWLHDAVQTMCDDTRTAHHTFTTAYP